MRSLAEIQVSFVTKPGKIAKFGFFSSVELNFFAKGRLTYKHWDSHMRLQIKRVS